MNVTEEVLGEVVEGTVSGGVIVGLQSGVTAIQSQLDTPDEIHGFFSSTQSYLESLGVSKKCSAIFAVIVVIIVLLFIYLLIPMFLR